ncbi:hypothetical protein IW492_14820 [Enterococcus sp. BWB1-3]|uniref:GDSL-type esterase/lipase family protein n=1 Tax=unclassified Enterococcus TaxID=2608891 RepID=UPI0019210AE5|nr:MULTISPECIES: GDSL-type esterase/lipase family protein [unclassified Enterococcus]MBL1230502.1 hypothetical protein [Enterococcus sp. BWB1-3]MCB5954217.1 GDSL-type esterase/lipase family protein [Enterococcus sp. CWB-B31]
MKWSNVWSYTQQDYRSWPSEIENQLQVIRIRSNHHTKSLKLRFSNEYGQENLILERVSICQVDSKTLKRGERKIVTVNCQEKISIFPAAQLISDEIQLELNPGTILEIETVVKERTILRSGTVSYSRRELAVSNYRLKDGKKEYVEQQTLFRMVKENERMFYIYGISGLDFLVEDTAKTIVAFGDSLTQQGFWVDALKTRFFRSGMHELAVLNRGIGGSRVLKGQNPENDRYTRHGNAGLFRFEREVFMYGAVDVVICLHGINDIISRHDGTGEYSYTLEELKSGIGQYAAFAHQHGAKVIVGTLTPLGQSLFYSDDLEKERQKINTWIRRNKDFDGIADFDFAVMDLEQNHRLQLTFDSGDGLHLSDLGGQKLAETIDLSYINSIIK